MIEHSARRGVNIVIIGAFPNSAQNAGIDPFLYNDKNKTGVVGIGQFFGKFRLHFGHFSGAISSVLNLAENALKLLGFVFFRRFKLTVANAISEKFIKF